jgi:hypothetical protein
MTETKCNNYYATISDRTSAAKLQLWFRVARRSEIKFDLLKLRFTGKVLSC